MGWSCFRHYGDTNKEIAKRELECTNEHGSWRVLDQSQKGRVIYSLVERKGGDAGSAFIPDEDGTYRFIVVTLCERRDGEVCVKNIDETMGPCETDCPKRLIAKASPLGPGASYAVKWRKECVEPKRRVSVASFPVGAEIEFKSPVYFDGQPATRFKVTTYYRAGKERKCFARQPDGMLCRISGLNDREFTVRT